ncbi:hypothetical protein [Deinococcus frigens]|uniref:hypothetical protein n=1 Tax=Deinococcus frigens TaxID=249403 RepID=UPI0012EBB222|nr:hypothetical protein [Deinococcus frigens]
MAEYFLIGTPPILDEFVVEHLVLETIRQNDSIEYSSLLVYLCCNQQWWRTFNDGPHLYWDRVDSPPTAWGAPEHGFTVEIHNIGEELQLRGQRLTHWAWDVSDGAPHISLDFSDGRQLTFCGHPWSTFSVNHWQSSP